ncbi:MULTISPECIES: helix-turn-helix domain-containing protein [Rhizobium/Agrobacterium group]|uniref:XRE family transcriptional regulator n=2 Tax=Rhizobium/Agrobacterium group TaxID=227290 RepID=A0A9X3KQQ9_9HYPH|nr:MULTISPECIES: XRE family transcriptional regulator [Rhizobium/Agrobacterium group]MBO9126238.1 helix-turn-helix transcriptional regulator [Rhizobium sp. 16-488-2b]MBO9176822.1 helix-turn-helix transcriptional regulator [Rhizobium sp. 16-488-2a]MBO9197391.1 helix-turn-helix transcriptional regulator [Rhizobium sp. 16-449-1b]MCZ7466748.1 XRE family transcriptional regulator [Rhizobium rhizogenes]MCZ7939222.1 XRE family transcriptional regulator [Agrobacterium salinitolerans]
MRATKQTKITLLQSSGMSENLSSDGRQELGQKLRDLRLERGLTLQEVSNETKVARSTLSKIENGVMSPTFDILQKLAAGFSLEIGALFSSTPVQAGAGRRSYTKSGEGPALSSKHYIHHALASDISKKRVLPFRTKVKARKISDFKTLISHEGEVFIFVVSGTVTFYSDLYAPLKMEAGDSIYFDSMMAHAIVSTSEEDADIVWVCDNIKGVEEGDLELH